MLALIGLIPLLPLAGFLVCGLLGKRLPKRIVTTVACGSVGLAFALSLAAVVQLGSLPPAGSAALRGTADGQARASQVYPAPGYRSYEITYWTWIPPLPFESAGPFAPPDTRGEALGAGAIPAAATSVLTGNFVDATPLATGARDDATTGSATGAGGGALPPARFAAALPAGAGSVLRETPSVPREGLSVPREGLSVQREGPSVAREGTSVLREGPYVPHEAPSVLREGPSVAHEGPSVPREGLSVPSVAHEAPSVLREGLSVPSVSHESPAVLREGLSVPSISHEAPSVPREGPCMAPERESAGPSASGPRCPPRTRSRHTVPVSARGSLAAEEPGGTEQGRGSGSASSGSGPGSRALEVAFGLRLDPLSAVMILIVTGVGFLIHVYSAGYMAHDPGYARYFSYLNLFMAMMLTLVLAANFLVMFVGWEGVGLCSYLLIGFWYEDSEKAHAGRKAFITNRIGDFAFMLALLAILYLFHTLDFSAVMAAIARGGVPTGMLTLIGLALFVGACGKSAQIPLFVWLPDAMAGPTPVSALIHAATMVTAGVYMVSRCAVLFAHAPAALATVAVVGAATALFAATIGLAQHDIKKVLAYSTVSQLGYMFLGAGVGAFAGSIFHLMTHAFFKALLFLGAGSVIHAMGGEQDMRRMGGLKDKLPWTYRTMGVAALAIAGIPVFAGFFSKDEILWKAWETGHPLLWVIGAAAAALTAFYMFRLVFLTFHGAFRGTHEQAHHLHESPPSMIVPLIVLAVLSVAGGWVGIPGSLGRFAGIPNVFERYLEPVLAVAAEREEAADVSLRPPAPRTGEVRTHAPSGISPGTRLPARAEYAAFSPGAAHQDHAETTRPAEYILMLVAIAIAILGILTARAFYLGPGERPERAARAAGPFYALVLNKYWVDELYQGTVLKAYYGGCALFESIDRWVIDGLVNAVAAFTEMVGQVLRLFQTGFVRNYALLVFAGAVWLVWILGR